MLQSVENEATGALLPVLGGQGEQARPPLLGGLVVVQVVDGARMGRRRENRPLVSLRTFSHEAI